MCSLSYKLAHLSVFIASLLLAGIALGNPEGGVVTAGEASISTSGNSTTINQTSQQVIVQWNSFNIASPEKTQFIQPNASSVALNRIDASHGASQIYGQLISNGRIILVNGAGIFFGPGARVDVGGLIASTTGISDANFLAGKFIFDQASQFHGSINNAGKIIAADNGLVALLGDSVSNSGIIQARQGSILIGSGNLYTLDFNGDQLINFSVNGAASTASKGIRNTGKLLADGGQILVTARAASGVLDDVINMGGIATTKSASRKAGQIILSGDENTDVVVSGKLIAAGRKGGTIQVTGNHVHLTSTAYLNASGIEGGGQINVGGNERGLGSLLNAATTTIDSGAVLNASALVSGDGGKVIVWSNDLTQYAGMILAEGGDTSGNGGDSEVSGHDVLNFIGSVNLTAAHGAMGNLLLDPQNITIQNAGPNSTNYSNGTYTPATDQSILTVATLVAQLGLSNVTVTTVGSTGGALGNITVADPVSWSGSAGGGTSLTLIAANNIYLNANITASDSSSSVNFLSPIFVGGNITVTAGNQINFNSTIDDAVSGGGTHSLTLHSQANQLSGNVGATNPLASLVLADATGSNTGADTISATSVSAHSQTYNNSVNLSNSAKNFSSTGGVIFNGTLDGDADVTFNTTSGVTFNNTVGINSALKSLNIASGSVTFNTTDIITTNNQNYANGLAVANSSNSPIEFTSQNGSLIFGGNINLSNGGMNFTLNGNNAYYTATGSFNNNATVTINTANFYFNNSNSNAFQGVSTLNLNTNFVLQSNLSTVMDTVNFQNSTMTATSGISNLSFGGQLFGNVTFNIEGVNTRLNVSDFMYLSGLIKTGVGTLSLGNYNNLTNNAAVVNQGTLAIPNLTYLANSSTFTVNSGATPDLNGTLELGSANNSYTINGATFNLNGTGQNGSGALIFNGQVLVAAQSTFNLPTNALITISSGSQLTLGDINTSGDNTQFTNSASSGTSTATLNGGGTLTFGGNLSGTGNVLVQDPITMLQDLTISTHGFSTTTSGTINKDQNNSASANLVVEASSFDLEGDIGDDRVIDNVTVANGATGTIGAANVTTASNQDYTGGNVTFHNATLTTLSTSAGNGGSISFNAVTFNSPNTHITADNQVNYNGQVAGTTSLESTGNGSSGNVIAGSFGTAQNPLNNISFSSANGDYLNFSNTSNINFYAVHDITFNSVLNPQMNNGTSTMSATDIQFNQAILVDTGGVNGTFTANLNYTGTNSYANGGGSQGVILNLNGGANAVFTAKSNSSPTMLYNLNSGTFALANSESLDNGILQINGTGQFIVPTAFNSNNAQVDFILNGDGTNSQLVFQSSMSLGSNVGIMINSNGGIAVQPGVNVTFNGVFNTSDSLTGQFNGISTGDGSPVLKTGGGTFTLASQNNFLSANIIEGTLSVTNSGALSDTVTVGANGNLQIAGVTLNNILIALDGGTLTAIGNSGTTATVDVAANSKITTLSSSDTFDVSGTVSGAATLQLAGAGTITVSNDITSLGGLTSSAGTAILPNVTTSSDQTYDGSVVINNDALFASTNGNIAFNNGISGAHDVTIMAGSSNNSVTVAGALGVNNITVNGNGSSSTLNVASPHSQQFNITSTNSGNVTGAGQNGLFNFNNIQNIHGSANGDTYHLAGGTITSITGGSGLNTLIADNVANTFMLTGVNSGSATGVGSFSAIQNLVGGTLNNQFVFANNAVLTGSINGTSTANNSISYSAYTAAMSLVLTANNTGFALNSAGTTITGGFVNIQSIMGNGISALNIAGSAANIVNFTGQISVSVNDPTSVSGFNGIYNAGSGTTNVNFGTGYNAVFNSPNSAKINGGPTIFFGPGITFSGNYITYSAPPSPPAPVNPDTQPVISINAYSNIANVITSPQFNNSDSNASLNSETLAATNVVITIIQNNLTELVADQAADDIIQQASQTFYPNCAK